MGIEAAILEKAAAGLAREIDAQIMQGFLTECGWTQVVLQPMTLETGAIIDSWTQQNIKHEFWTYGLVWMFKDHKDANWFILRWGSQ
jgi:hypothetical protein